MKKLITLAMATLFLASCNNNTETSTPEPQDNNAISTIMNRKSVRSYSGEAVSDSMINELLRAAMAAPSGMNVQPWHFVVLRDTAAYTDIFGTDNFNLEMFKQASAVVVFCADTTVTRPPRENPDAPAETKPNKIWRDDMGACTENFLLAAEANGLGACWTALYPYPDRMAPVTKALGLPENCVVYCAVPVGRPAGDNQPKDKWKPERIHQERW